MEFTPINSQEQFDAAISERIGRVNKKHDEAVAALTTAHEAALAELQGKYDALAEEKNALIKSAEETSAKQTDSDNIIAELNAKIKSYEMASVKARIARETGLPYDMADRLRGETEEELKADAEALVSLMPKAQAMPLPSQKEVIEESALDKKYKNSRFYRKE